MRMRKGVTGKIITTIISLIVAIIALALLWAFLSGLIKYESTLIPRIMYSIKSWFCEVMGWGAKILFRCSSLTMPPPPPITETPSVPEIKLKQQGRFNIVNSGKLKVQEIIVDVENTVSNPKLTVTRTYTKPDSVEIDAPDNVYVYLEIEKRNIEDEDVARATIKFKVEKSWIVDNNIDENTITLNRYSDNVWNELFTPKLSEDSDYVYFEAESPELSVFAITARESTTTIPFTPTACNLEELNVNSFPAPGQGVFQCHDASFNKNYMSGWDLLLEWSDVEPSEDNYDFSKVDDFLNKLKSNNKRGQIIFVTFLANSVPDWVGNDFLIFRQIKIPVPWDAKYQEHLNEVLKELGKKLQESDPCKLVEIVQMSAGGPWGDVSIYSRGDLTSELNYIRKYLPNSDGSNSDRKEFAKKYSKTTRELIDIYENNILDRPVVLIGGGGLTSNPEDSLPDYMHVSVEKYGGRLYAKEAGVGLGSDCGVKLDMARYCKPTKGTWPWNCDFDECPATRCLYEPHGTLAQFQQYGCDYGYNYIGESLDGQKRYGDCAVSIKGSMFCIYTADLNNNNLNWVHEKLHSYAGSHIKVLSAGLEIISTGGKISFNLELSGNLPPFVFERQGIKDVPRSMKIKVYLKQSNEFTDIGHFEPSPSSLTWREADYRYPNQASAEVVFETPGTVESGSYQVYAAFHDPMYYYNWPVSGINVDSYHRFYVGNINIG